MTLVDLFAGCGGMSLGFQNAGFEIIAAFDNWEPAINVYSQNFNHPIFNLDLSNENEAILKLGYYKPDIIVGGPPCQDFSIAGKRNEKTKRANLTISFARIVSTLRPKCFVMENVYNITKSKVLPIVKDHLKNAGYGLTSVILDSQYLGVPQARKRFFLIGCIGEVDDFLLKPILENQSNKSTTVFDYLGDSLKTEYYYMHPRSYNRRAIFSIYEPSSTIRGVNRPIPKDYKEHHGDKARMSEKVRSLTTLERSYLQTFPEKFILNGNKTALEQLIGNAVPVKMAQYVATELYKFLNCQK